MLTLRGSAREKKTRFFCQHFSKKAQKRLFDCFSKICLRKTAPPLEKILDPPLYEAHSFYEHHTITFICYCSISVKRSYEILISQLNFNLIFVWKLVFSLKTGLCGPGLEIFVLQLNSISFFYIKGEQFLELVHLQEEKT